MHSIEKYSFDVLYILSLNENNKYWDYLCFFVHHHIACLCNVIIYCKTRVMAKFRCWGLPLNIEYWKQCILTKEFWDWTMIPHYTLVFSLHVSRTFVDFLLLVDKTRSKYCFDQVMLQNTKKGTLISFFDIFLYPLSNVWQVFTYLWNTF